MQPEQKTIRPAQFRKLALSVLLVPLIFASLILAVSQALHEKLHAEASKSSHQCAITLFAQQQIIDSEPNSALVEVNPSLVLWIVDADFRGFSSVDYSFSASRAPPFFFL